MKTIKLLMIGNSFSEDTSHYASQIASKMGFSLEICNMYIGGCTLDTHLAKAKSKEGAYDMQVCKDGVWESNLGRTLDDGILLDDWDIITLQQASGFSGIPSSYDGYLEELLAYVKSKARNKDAHYYWHMTWPYSKGSAPCDFPKYDCDQEKMYQAILDCVQTKVIGKGFDKIIPAGTAIQNARLLFPDEKLSRDKFHLSYDLGRFIAGIALVETLFDADSRCFSLSCPTDEEDENLAKICAHNAILSPFKLTPINNKKRPF